MNNSTSRNPCLTVVQVETIVKDYKTKTTWDFLNKYDREYTMGPIEFMKIQKSIKDYVCNNK